MAIKPKKAADGDEDGLMKEIPLLDNVLTGLFVLCVCQMVRLLLTRPNGAGLQSLAEVCVFFVVVGIAIIPACKHTAGVVFNLLATPSTKKKTRNGRKFKDQSWQLCIHTVMTLYGLWILSPSGPENGWEWVKDTTTCYIGPGGARGEPAGQWLERVYVLQCAIWAYTAVSHRWIDARHKDYYVMFTHHVLTIFLVTMSWGINLRFGVLVLLLHDASDIGIDLVKMANYAGLGLDGDYRLPITETVFVLALIVWSYLRLYVFPFHLLPSAYWESDGVCEGTWDGCLLMRMSLSILAVMHVWWTYLLVRVLFGGISKSAAKEVYEGNSGSDADYDNATKVD